MIKLILKRFLLMIPLLFLISIVVFSLAIIQPGDPFSGQYNPHVKQEAIDAQREKLGLNDSIPTQYVRWIGNVAHGNLGESIKYKRPVMDLIIERMPNTILLGVVSLIITYIVVYSRNYFREICILVRRLHNSSIQLRYASNSFIYCRCICYLYLCISISNISFSGISEYQSSRR